MNFRVVEPSSSPREPSRGAWYVVEVNPRAEYRAAEELTGIAEAYVPSEFRWIMHARKRERVRRPLFVGYIFARLDLTAGGMHAVKTARGVRGFLGVDRPLPVLEELVERIRRVEDAGALDKTATGLVFERGELLRIAAGPFEGVIGEVVRAEGKRRVEVLLSFMHRRVPMTVDVDNVERA